MSLGPRTKVVAKESSAEEAKYQKRRKQVREAQKYDQVSRTRDNSLTTFQEVQE